MITALNPAPGNTVTARDGSGHWTGELIRQSSDGWALTRVTTAPKGMLQWVGNVIEFPPNEIQSIA